MMAAAGEILLHGLARTTLGTTCCALLAFFFLPRLGIHSTRAHRIAWLLVIAQGWFLLPMTWEIPSVGSEHEIDSSQKIVDSRPAPRVAQTGERPDEFNWRKNAALLILGAWFVGPVVLLSLDVKRYFTLVAQLPLGKPPDTTEWQDEWQAALGEIAPKCAVQLRITNNVGPLLCFVPFVHLVLVPKGLWGSLDQIDRVAILQHELSHFRRGDLWKNLAARVLALPQWFNPLVWLAVRRFQEAGEWACDNDAITVCRLSHKDYANTLLRVAGFSPETTDAAIAVTGGVLTRRVERLLHTSHKETSKMKNVLVPLLLLTIAVAQTIRIESLPAQQQKENRESRQSAANVPNELNMVSLPRYVIEPPDTLRINAIKVVPKPPHVIEPFDGLLIRVIGVPPDQPIADVFSVTTAGNVDLGPTYGKVEVAGLTIDKAEAILNEHLEHLFQDVDSSISLAFSAGGQQITGEHAVAPDGYVNLGTYGSVHVAGKTVDQARKAIETHLEEYLVDPEVVIEVLAYASKKYYVVTINADGVDNVQSLPITGQETVLDAIARIGSIPSNASTKVWVARPALGGDGSDQILPVNWRDISLRGATITNYQLLPGDRLVINADKPAENEGTSPAPPLEAGSARPLN